LLITPISAAAFDYFRACRRWLPYFSLSIFSSLITPLIFSSAFRRQISAISDTLFFLFIIIFDTLILAMLISPLPAAMPLLTAPSFCRFSITPFHFSLPLITDFTPHYAVIFGISHCDIFFAFILPFFR
jgi:hypothetical protein